MGSDLNEPSESSLDDCFNRITKTDCFAYIAAPILGIELQSLDSCAVNCGIKRNGRFVRNYVANRIEQSRLRRLHLRAVKRHIPLNNGKQSSTGRKCFGCLLNR